MLWKLKVVLVYIFGVARCLRAKKPLLTAQKKSYFVGKQRLFTEVNTHRKVVFQSHFQLKVILPLFLETRHRVSPFAIKEDNYSIVCHSNLTSSTFYKPGLKEPSMTKRQFLASFVDSEVSYLQTL